MFTLNFGELRQVDAAVNELLTKQFPVRPGSTKTMYWLGNLAKKIASGMTDGQAEYVKVVKRHAKLDEKGNFIPAIEPAVLGEDGAVITEAKPIPNSYILLDDHKDLLQKDMDEFATIPAITMKCNKFQLSELEGVPGLTPEMLLSLDPIIDFETQENVLPLGIVPA